MNIAKRIIELREKRNMTTNKLANEAGVSQSHLREIELGKKSPTIEMLSYICYALNVSLSEFFHEEKHIEPFLLNAVSKLNSEEQIALADFLTKIKNK